MSEPRNAPSLLGEALLQAIRQAVREEIQAASSQNGNHKEGQLLDVEEAAKRWSVPKSWISDMARRGEIPCVHLGHYVRFDPTELGQFIKDHGSHLPSQRNTPGKKSS